MKYNRLITSLAAAGALVGLAGVAQAAPAVVASTYNNHSDVVVRTAPPPPVFERAPGVREGYVWAPGYHEWRNGRYEWHPGYWVSARPGYVWEEARWIQRPDGTWHLAGNTWARRGPYGDRDGDGIPNRYDTARNDRSNPYGDIDGDGILNRDDHDRDGDGVPNRYDNYPNNPYRN